MLPNIGTIKYLTVLNSIKDFDRIICLWNVIMSFSMNKHGNYDPSLCVFKSILGAKPSDNIINFSNIDSGPTPDQPEVSPEHKTLLSETIEKLKSEVEEQKKKVEEERKKREEAEKKAEELYLKKENLRKKLQKRDARIKRILSQGLSKNEKKKVVREILQDSKFTEVKYQKN